MTEVNFTPIKICSKCKQPKPATLEFYYVRPGARYGVTGVCKDCKCGIQRAERLAASPALKRKRLLEGQGQKECSACGVAKDATRENFYTDRGKLTGRCIDCKKAERADYRNNNPELVRAQLKSWASRNREYISYKNSEWKKRNPGRSKEYMDAYYASNKQAFIDGNSRRSKLRREADPVFAMSCRVRSALGDVFRRMGYTKRSKTQDILGCTWDEFKRHIELQFLKGMSWENKDKWHLDHLIPISTAKTEADVLALSHHTNLRPLWAADNMRKSDMVTHLI